MGALQIADLIRVAISEQKPDQAKRFVAGNDRDCTLEELLGKNPADIILLMIGTNDILRDVETALAPERLDALIGMLVRTSPAALFVASIPPTYGRAEQRFDEKVKAHNARVLEVVRTCQAKGVKVSFVEVFGHLGPEDTLSANVHPNMRGDRKIGNPCYTAIYPTVRDPTKSPALQVPGGVKGPGERVRRSRQPAAHPGADFAEDVAAPPPVAGQCAAGPLRAGQAGDAQT